MPRIIAAAITALAFAGIAAMHSTAGPVFTDSERARLVEYWAQPNRYSMSLPAQYLGAPWQVRLTPEGSIWLHSCQQAIGGGKAPPTADPTAQAGGMEAWKAWVQKKVASDRWIAQQTADRLNASVTVAPAGQTAKKFEGQGGALTPQPPVPTPIESPPTPGPIPPDLLAAAGNPPALACATTPMQHTVTFDAAEAYVYQDHRNVPATYAYYRFPQGVGTGGTPLTDAERTELFAAAGLTETQKRVMMVVSKFEGSFDAVNTYDTGYVSVGFIQFITLDDGRHSLADVLCHEKVDAPADFEQDFHRFGVDLTPDRVVTVVDPTTGAELVGPEAVRKIVDDKRLIAVFQRAGKTSRQFRVAQIRVAKENYWPEDDPVRVELNGQTLTGKVSDVIKSEAGLATFFDRKVNRGSVNPLAAEVARVMLAHDLKTLPEAQRYEKEIVAACKYRGDFLAEASLKQPGNEAGTEPK